GLDGTPRRGALGHPAAAPDRGAALPGRTGGRARRGGPGPGDGLGHLGPPDRPPRGTRPTRPRGVPVDAGAGRSGATSAGGPAVHRARRLTLLGQRGAIRRAEPLRAVPRRLLPP